MASNIVPSTAGWNTTNMKPAADEEIPALWGQNIADNTGFLYQRTILDDRFVGNFNGKLYDDGDTLPITNTISGMKLFFIKKPEQDSINGTVYTSYNETGFSDTTFGVEVDGNSAYTKNYTADGNDTASFTYDASGLTDGLTYEIEFTVTGGATSDTDLAELVSSVTVWSAA